MRRLICLLTVSAVSASLLVAGPMAIASASGDASATAAAYNKKKCKKAKTKKQKKKYCKKKKAPQQQQGGQQTGTGTGTGTGTQTGTGTGTSTGTATDPNAQVVRDDAGFTNALVGSHFKKYEEGTYGYGEYNWDFCQGGQWRYRSYYSVNGSAPESNNGGSYTVEQGYHAAADPNYYGGFVVVTTSSGAQYRFGVEIRGGQGFIKTGSKDFTEGNYSRTAGAAAC